MDEIKFMELLKEVNSLHNEDIRREEEVWELENETWRPHDQWKCAICNWIIDGIHLILGGKNEDQHDC